MMGSMNGEADIGVVGAGIVGLCTAFALRERGASVRVYESGFPGRGQSAGETRIFRHAHDDPRLVAFAQESRALWDEWADRLGVELLSDDGAVVLGPAVQRRLALLEDAGVPARAIGPSELSEWLPQLARYEGPALLDEAGGALRVRAAIAALTAELGDDLVTEEVISVRPTGWGTVEVRGVGTRAEHAKVVVCAGRGTARLARGAGLDLPLRFGAAARVTFDVVDHSERLACLQDGSDAFGEVGAYASAYARQPPLRGWPGRARRRPGRRQPARPFASGRGGESDQRLRGARAPRPRPAPGRVRALLGHRAPVERRRRRRLGSRRPAVRRRESPLQARARTRAGDRGCRDRRAAR